MGNESTREKEIVYSEFLQENLVGRFPTTDVIERMNEKVIKKLEHNVYFGSNPFKATPKLIQIDLSLSRETNKSQSKLTIET